MKEIFLEFDLFGTHITLRWFQVMAASGFLAALFLLKRRSKLYGQDPEKVETTLFYSMIGAILGARLLFVVRYWEENFANRPFSKVFAFQEGGLVFQGGLIGGLIIAYFVCRRNGIKFLTALDIAAPCIALAHAFGRVGCFLNGCCFGGKCDIQALAVQYPKGSFPWSDHLKRGLIEPSSDLSMAVHPAPLYAVFALVSICILLCYVSKKLAKPGMIFGLYFCVYSLWRFTVEFFRDDQDLTAGLSLAQYIALGTLALGCVIIALCRRNREYDFPKLEKD
ncbi:prolipoprotein diacylglyceryl transferase [Lentisphaera profundi]|uniref:Phosphatidylglycerol--prolipoprotein diacylglyceryl transferase n=1 Tax=Lentisphaera profundi TaxID=1658616 RepID=A0ABY7VYC5_9BACT|nr:prolipoprotein diacylglyceryl transferase [Lentisphaera profundi]WDE97872.1 prolipoprotein diacylglyceryl transferase [Lentisphaera profundi]